MIIVSRVLPIFLLAAALLVAGCGGGSQEEQGSQEETTTTAAPETTTGGGSTTEAQGGGGGTAQVVAATEAWLATLDDTQREQVGYDFDDDEAKANWSNFPVQVVPRNGVALRDMMKGLMAYIA